MNSRIFSLKAKLHVDKYPICCEKARLVTESFQQTEGEPQIVRRTQALANVLRNMPIFIENEELIVGNAASKPMGVEIDYDYGIWPADEIHWLREEGYDISDKDEADIVAMNSYWKTQTLVSRCGQIYDDRLWSFKQTGIVLPPWKSRTEGSGGGYAQSGMGLGPGFYLFGVDFAKVINCGLNSIIEQAKDELASLRYMDNNAINKSVFLSSVIKALSEVITFAGRFADLADKLKLIENSPQRIKELEKISETCRWVPANPARTFYEALQSFWFTFILINPSTTAAAGRFDQYMYPYYKKDKDAGLINDEQVIELLECLRIKDMQLNRTSGRINRQKNAGMAKWHNWTIGGVTPDGRDATNELSYLILEAARDCQTPHHTITVRVHDNTPEALMLKALEVVKTGIGMPAFVGDYSYIEFLLSHGVPLEDAREYIMTGCIDANLVGKSRIASYDMFIVPLVLDIFLHNGVEPRNDNRLIPESKDVEKFQSFDSLIQAFKKQLAYFMGLSAECNNIHLKACADLFPDPFRSSLMVNALKEGKEMLERTLPYENAAVLNAVGMINVADSLAAIKQLVFEQKKITMKELKAALDANWQGERYAEIQKMCLAAPKYGNGNPLVDNIAADLYKFWAETAVTFGTIFNGTHKPTGISISAQWPGGALTGATPDGRFAGECLADGTMSPMRGRDTYGPTAVIRSAGAVNQLQYQATLLNMKFHPSALVSTEDMQKLSSLIKTYFSMGGKHIQFNVVNRETLLEAQKHPENYRDLIVRVAGYSAFFVQLGKVIQDEIINRTEHRQTAC
jgi:pyruvate formate-lyase/glycerol dehydratase family glycyl radical enzyme